jgi:hypothetical protein
MVPAVGYLADVRLFTSAALTGIACSAFSWLCALPAPAQVATNTQQQWQPQPYIAQTWQPQTYITQVPAQQWLPQQYITIGQPTPIQQQQWLPQGWIVQQYLSNPLPQSSAAPGTPAAPAAPSAPAAPAPAPASSNPY